MYNSTHCLFYSILEYTIVLIAVLEYTNSLVVEGKKHPNLEKNGRELNLVSIDAEFPID